MKKISLYLASTLEDINKKNWFSLIELLIVVTIIAIISISWFFYFTKFSDDFYLKNSLYSIKSDFEDFDNKVNRKEVFDYELYLNKDLNYYYIYENVFDLDWTFVFDNFDSVTWVWTFSFSWFSSWTWNISYYNHYKFQKEEIIDYNWSFTWKLDLYKTYKFNSSFLWETLNSIYFHYFDNKNLIKLVWINDWTSELNSIKINNVLWKKIFWDDETINKITLTFENIDWNREILEIIK